MRSVYFLFIAVALIQPSRAEQTSVMRIGTPSLGWVFDPDSHALRPISGSLGSAVIGDPINIGFSLQTAIAASERAVAIGVSSEDGRPYIIRLGSNIAAPHAIEGADASPDKIVLSASGSAAILYFSKTGRVQTVTGLPDNVSVTSNISLPTLNGTLANLAINDAGDRLLITVREGDHMTLWMLNDHAGFSVLPVQASDIAIAFRSNAGDAVAATSAGELYVIGSDALVSHYTAMEDNNGTPVDVQVSADATRALVAYKSGSIVKVDTASGAVQTTTCGCTPTGLHRMNASPVFRINEPSGLPLLLVEELDSGPRMWFVPPVVRESANERGEQ